MDGLLSACDASDGLKDGMVFNIQACRFDPKTLVCKGEKADGCLSMSQAAALQKAFAGPKDSKGRQVHPGFAFDTGIVGTQDKPGLLNGYRDPANPPFSEIGMDVDSWVEKAMSLPGIAQGETWSWTNLNTFSGHGGKLVFWHGLSDPTFSALDTVGYYERMTKDNVGSRTGAQLEPLVPGSRGGALQSWAARARHVRCLVCHRSLGGAGCAPR